MERDNCSNLLNDLEQLGYLNEEMKSSILGWAGLDVPYFNHAFALHYDNDSIHFLLHIRKDPESAKGYYLEKIDAHYWKSGLAYVEQINGVKLVDLVKRMDQVNWQSFIKQDKIHLSKQSPFETKVMDDFWKLTDNDNVIGIYAQSLLQNKYFAGTSWHLTLLKNPLKPYERKETFIHTPSNYIDYTAALCYQMLSGNFDTLLSKVNSITQQDLKIYLQRAVRRNQQQFELDAYKYFPEGIMIFKIPIQKGKDNVYEIRGFQATLLSNVEIQHGIYADIDTRNLEERMRQIDWNEEQAHYTHFRYDNDEYFFVPDIERIVSELHYQLPTDPEGKIVARQLELKYWLESPDFNGIISQGAWDYLNSMQGPILNFPASTSAKVAYNTLCGRAIRKDPESNVWTRLVAGKDKSIPHELVSFDGFTEENLGDLIVMLPAGDTKIQAVVSALNEGDIVTVTLNNGDQILIEAFPEQNTLKLFSLDGHPIFTNLLLSPGENHFPGVGENKIQKDEEKLNLPIKLSFKKYKKKKGKRY